LDVQFGGPSELALTTGNFDFKADIGWFSIDVLKNMKSSFVIDDHETRLLVRKRVVWTVNNRLKAI